MTMAPVLDLLNAGLTRRPDRPARVAAAAGLLAERIAGALFEWHERQRERHQLLTLDERGLHDIGLSRYDAVVEGRKPFWRA